MVQNESYRRYTEEDEMSCSPSSSSSSSTCSFSAQLISIVEETISAIPSEIPETNDDDSTAPTDSDANCTPRKKKKLTKRSDTPPFYSFSSSNNTKRNDVLMKLNQEKIDVLLGPIRKALEEVDAEQFLSLKRIMKKGNADGAVLKDGINVHPIHDQIVPKHHYKTTSTSKTSTSIVRYLHITEVENQYSIGIFVFPPHTIIPLHDHPGMVVLSRVLYGDLMVKSFDLLHHDHHPDHFDEKEDDKDHNDDNQSNSKSSWLGYILSLFYSSSKQHPKSTSQKPNGTKKASSQKIKHLTAPGISILYPQKGNAHEFTAGPNGAAVLDVLLPPYNYEHERNCTFYRVVKDDQQHGNDANAKNEKGEKQQKCWLLPVAQPKDFHCLSGKYGGLGDVNDH